MERSAQLADPEVFAGLGWDFSCPDWERRLREGRSLVPDLPLDRDAAEKAVKIYNKLCLPDVPGTPPLAKAGGEWFRDIVRALFGSIERVFVPDPDTGEPIEVEVRRVGQVFLLVPKKNSKTTNGAAVMLTALLLNKRPRAKFWLIGLTQEIADTAFGQASGMILADPEGVLQKRFHIRDHIKTIVDRKHQAELEIKTFDLKVATGGIPVGVLLDEVHLLGKSSQATKLLQQIRGGMQPNRESFLMMITTQSDDAPAGAFKDELEYARDVRDGKIKSRVRMLPVLYEFPKTIQSAKDKPWENPKLWRMVTPNLGRSIALDTLIEGAEEQRQKGDEAWRIWASQHLNIQIGVAIAAGKWAGADHWEKSADATLTLASLIERSEVCVVGIDGGGLEDLLGVTVAGREKGTRRTLTWSCAWIRRTLLTTRKEIAPRLEDFARAGELIITDEPGVDVIGVADVVEEVDASGKLAEKNAIGVDPVGIAQIVDELTERELGNVDGEAPRIVAVSQGWKLSGAIRTAEVGLADGTIIHADQALMDWCVGNAKAEPKGNAMTITKQISGSAKIDPLMAFFDAIALMSMNPAARESAYEHHGFRVL